MTGGGIQGEVDDGGDVVSAHADELGIDEDDNRDEEVGSKRLERDASSASCEGSTVLGR